MDIHSQSGETECDSAHADTLLEADDFDLFKTACNMSSHAELRRLLNDHQLKTNFQGSVREQLLMIYFQHLRRTLPPYHYCKKVRLQMIKQQAARQLHGVSLHHLAALMDDSSLQHYKSHGWLKISLNLTKHELQFVRWFHDADPAFGWLRAPMSPLQYYLITHPTVYTIAVAMHAIFMLRAGANAEDVNNVRACIELTAHEWHAPPAAARR